MLENLVHSVFNTLCIKLVGILNEDIFSSIKALRSLVAIATKASTQRRAGQKGPVKMFMNLGYSVFNQSLC